MVNFIDKFTGRRPENDESGRGLATRSEHQKLAPRPSRLVASRRGVRSEGRIPNASKIYGAAAAAFFVIACYFVFIKGVLLTGLLILGLSAALLGYALFFMRFQN